MKLAIALELKDIIGEAIASVNNWYATVKKSQWINLEDVLRVYRDV